RMRRQGLIRAASYARESWRERFGALIEELIDLPPRTKRHNVEIQPRVASRSVPVNQHSLLLPVQVINHGSQPLVHEGPARTSLCSTVLDGAGTPIDSAGLETPLPGLVLPWRAAAAVVRVSVPETPG